MDVLDGWMDGCFDGWMDDLFWGVQQPRAFGMTIMAVLKLLLRCLGLVHLGMCHLLSHFQRHMLVQKGIWRMKG